MTLRGFYARYDAALGVVFDVYSSLVYRHPWYILGFCVLYNCLFGLGFLRFHIETDMEQLFTPENNEALVNIRRIRELFQNKSRNNFYPKSLTNLNTDIYGSFIIRTKNGSNLLTQSNLAELRKIDEVIRNEVEFTNGSVLRLHDVCARNAGRCVVSGDFVLHELFPVLVRAGHIPYPHIARKSLSAILAGVRVVNGSMVSASIVRLVYHLQQDTQGDRDRAYQWENSFVDRLKHYKSNNTEIAVRNSLSVTDEFEKGVFGESKYFILTIVCMCVYAAFAVSGGNCVSGRWALAIAGVLSTCLAIVGAFGLVSGLEVSYVSICGVIPFLVVGIGLDDMFILLSCMAATPKTISISDRVKTMMRTGGVAITVTSLTDFLAFIVGSTSVFNSVRYFCIYTGVSVIFCYLNQLLFLVPCIIINERRTFERRHSITCQVTRSTNELRASNHSALVSLCCGGDPPQSASDIESPLERYPKRLLRRVIPTAPVKVGAMLLFVGYIGMSVYGAVNVSEDFLVSYLVSEDSYVYKYLVWTERDFQHEVLVSFVVDGEVDYSDPIVQSKVTAMLKRARNEAIVQRSREINWLLGYKHSIYNDSGTNFTGGLKTFLKSRKDYDIDVIFDESGKNIIASRFYVMSKNIKDSRDSKLLLTSMRGVAKSSGLPVIAHAPTFTIDEQFVAIGPSTLQTIVIAMAAMLVVTLVVMPHPLVVALVCGSMFSIMLGVYGFLYLWGLSLNSITMIQLIMSIGFSVDFSAHVCHAYMTAKGSTRAELVDSAISISGGAIINAAMSSILGVFMLAFMASYVFKSFFKIMFLVMVFGMLHALLFLPVALLVCGPRPSKCKTDTAPSSTTVSTITLTDVTPTTVSTITLTDVKPTTVSTITLTDVKLSDSTQNGST